MGVFIQKGKDYVNPPEGFDENARAKETARQLVADQALKAYGGGKGFIAAARREARSMALPRKTKSKEAILNPQHRIHSEAALAAKTAMEAMRRPEPKEDEAFPGRMVDADGNTRYITDADKMNLRQMEAFGPQSIAHLAAARNSSVAYMRRRCVILEQLKLIKKQVHPLWKSTYNLTPLALDYFIDSQFLPSLNSTRPSSFSGDHMKHSNINTIVAKLMAGADEEILFDKDETRRHEPVPIISKSWIDASSIANSGKAVSSVYDSARSKLEDSVSMHPDHPVRRAKFKRNATLFGHTEINDNVNLLSIYRDMDTAWMFSTHDASRGLFTRSLNPDFVILRPIVMLSDGGWDFDNDACYALTMPLSSDDYKAIILSVYATGMYGRIQFFRSPNKRLADDVIAGTWNQIVKDKILGPSLIPFGEPGCFVRIRDFADPVNHTGRGEDQFNARGERLARTRFDG